MTCALTPRSSPVPELERVARDAGVPVHATALTVTPITAQGVVATARLDIDDEHGFVVVRAHVAGTTAADAVDHALARLRDQLAAAAKEPLATGDATGRHWTFGSMPAHRPAYVEKPARERSLARTKVYEPTALAPEQAVRVAALRDVDFHLFVDVRDGRPAVVRRGDTNDWAVVEPTACGIDTAVEMLDVSHARFVCFLASPASGLHAVYRRFDGDYAWLSPA
jgi:hypothetical protein